MKIDFIRQQTGMTQEQFGNYFNIPRRTIQNWESGARTAPEYLPELMIRVLESEGYKIVFPDTAPYADDESVSIEITVKEINGDHRVRTSALSDFGSIKPLFSDIVADDFPEALDLVDAGETDYLIEYTLLITGANGARRRIYIASFTASSVLDGTAKIVWKKFSEEA